MQVRKRRKLSLRGFADASTPEPTSSHDEVPDAQHVIFEPAPAATSAVAHELTQPPMHTDTGDIKLVE